MSKRTRIFFAKLTHFFKRYFGSSRPTASSSSDDIPPAGPTPTRPPQLSTASPSHQYGPPASLPHTPSPLPQPPAPSTSQLPILPPTSSPPPPQSLQLPPHPVDDGAVPLHPTPPFPTYDGPPQPPLNLALRPPTGLMSPPSLPPASRAPTPQPHELTYFEGAHDFTFHNPQFINNSLGKPGIDKLLQHSMPDAFHDSAARYPPPKCHLATRKEYIALITDWARGNSNHEEPILWMRGPFGIGKSAVAQSCAEALNPKGKLVATLFFSRSNTDRDDPRRVFTSIAFQIATRCECFSDLIDARIRRDPSLTTKSLPIQFNELLVRPLSQVDITTSGIDGCVVIIDGLDECRGSSEQCEIVEIIAASAREGTTPFRWFITSRPEDPIIRTMNSKHVSSVSFHLELPVSRETDHEILIYLVDEFTKIRERHHLPDSWPSEEVLALLVDRTAGLWIYITTIVRFIADENGFGPEDQLRIVLNFLKDVSVKVEPDNPLTEMDFFYTLIMERVPLKIRTIVRKILLVYSTADDWNPAGVAIVLDLSEEQFRRSCAFIQSVVELRGSEIESLKFHFYHASFLDFMKDPKRSKGLSIHGILPNDCRRECLDWVRQVCFRSTDSAHITFPSEPILFPGWNRNECYRWKIHCLWRLLGVPDHPIDLGTAALLEKLDFQMMLRLIDRRNESLIYSRRLNSFNNNLPTDFRDKIVREGKCPISGCTNTNNVWIFGQGENEAIAQGGHGLGVKLKNNQDPGPGQCVCGFQISKDDAESSDSD